MEPLPPYASTRERAGRIAFISFCALILLFLIFPLLVIIPISFTSGATLTLEPEMLALEREAFSWRWYEAFLADEGWRRALYNSFTISPVAALIATVLGTMAALGLSQSQLPFKGVIMGVLISPMIVPLIISATGMYFFYSRMGQHDPPIGALQAQAA
ncbi:MAG: ABC transporter permease, partial [Pseudomonadota bacterium]